MNCLTFTRNYNSNKNTNDDSGIGIVIPGQRYFWLKNITYFRTIFPSTVKTEHVSGISYFLHMVGLAKV